MSEIFYSIGLMSGTSMDGVDAVLLATDGQDNFTRLAQVSIPYPSEFRQALKAAEQQLTQLATVDFPPLPDLAAQSTFYHQQAISELLKNTSNKPDIIGYHGQTLCHRPQESFTLQIGLPQSLANYFHLPVIWDFRQNDLCHGGQGAPIAPLYHQALIRQQGWQAAAIINCGGIANLSLMTATTLQAGFDTGPGNVLLDRFVVEMTDGKQRYDENGRYALQGQVDQDLLQNLWTNTCQNYYTNAPPKSLDSQSIRWDATAYLARVTDRQTALYNGCATLAAFTAQTIVKSITLLEPPYPLQWIIAGGGAHHPVIVRELHHYLQQLLPNAMLQTADAAGLSSTYLEAELMAWLAVRSVKNLPLTLPATTGVSKAVSGGRLILPNR